MNIRHRKVVVVFVVDDVVMELSTAAGGHQIENPNDRVLLCPPAQRAFCLSYVLYCAGADRLFFAVATEPADLYYREMPV